MAKRRSKDLTMEGEEKVDGVSWWWLAGRSRDHVGDGHFLRPLWKFTLLCQRYRDEEIKGTWIIGNLCFCVWFSGFGRSAGDAKWTHEEMSKVRQKRWNEKKVESRMLIKQPFVILYKLPKLSLGCSWIYVNELAWLRFDEMAAKYAAVGSLKEMSQNITKSNSFWGYKKVTNKWIYNGVIFDYFSIMGF